VAGRSTTRARRRLLNRLEAVRVIIFHGYLLGGTGSNVYNARLAEALVRLGHDVHLLCQERHPEQHGFIDAAGDWDEGSLHVRPLGCARGPERHGDEREGREWPAEAPEGRGSCTVYRPDIGGLLPVYVADRYEGVQARTFAQCSDTDLDAYVAANVAAVSDVVALAGPELALANHLVMGPAILARGLAGEVPYAVKVHGSALEYTVKPEPERFLPWAREGLAGAAAVLVGSRHTAESLWRALAEDALPCRTRLGPPGVDVERFAPREPAAAAAGLRELVASLREEAPAEPGGQASSAFARDGRQAGRALALVRPGEDALVAFVGKLIVSKGVDLLLAAFPLVLAEIPRARLVIVGFGAYRDALQSLLDALAGGDLAAARTIARAGRSLEDPDAPELPLRHLLAFLEGLAGDERERYVRAAAALHERVLLTGRLDHEELADLLPACEAMVVPSTFPEAFGMVAAEGAACGALPLSAAHSGLAEVSEELARAVPAEIAPLLSFPVDDGSVRAIAERLVAWLGADATLRAQTRSGLVAVVRERWSWEGVARGVIAAARGELETLREP
jgi:glycosyltransferase involved in cell wall biosynthesis